MVIFWWFLLMLSVYVGVAKGFNKETVYSYYISVGVFLLLWFITRIV